MVGMTHKEFNESGQEASKDPVIQKQLQQQELDIRKLLDKTRVIVETKEEVRQIYRQLIEMETELDKRLKVIRFESQNHQQAYILLEKTKIMDTLFLKYNMKYADILASIAHYQLEQDDDIKKLK